MTATSDFRVIGILGRSYCGSSIANLILGSHSKTFGAGELYRAVRLRERAYCAVCRGACCLWQPEFMQRLTVHNVYETLSRRVRKPIIVDSSKLPGWFSATVKANDRRPLRPLLLTKHPLRHVGSFVANQFLRRTAVAGAQDRRNPAPNGFGELEPFVLKFLADTKDFYKNIQSNQLLVRFAELPVVHYEDLIEDPKGSLSPILADLGLEFEPALMAYDERKHHPLGGNTGAHFGLRFQDRRSRQAEDWISNHGLSDEWKKYYRDDIRVLKIDNKYKSILPEDIICKILENDNYKEICHMLNYSINIEA